MSKRKRGKYTYSKAQERKWYLRKKYGITPEFEAELYEGQGHRCGICGKLLVFLASNYALDHDHITALVRGILCDGCNTKLGWFEKRKNKVEQYLNHPPAASMHRRVLV